MTNHRSLSRLCFALGLSVLAGCATRTQAPVVDRGSSQPPVGVPVLAKPEPVAAAAEQKPDAGKSHTIVRGDTLIAIALQYGLDYRELAAWNNIENVNVIRLGANLRLTAPGSATAEGTAPIARPGAPVATPLLVAAAPTPVPEKPPANTAAMKTEPKGGKVPFSEQALARLNAEAANAVSPAPTPTPAATVPPTAGATPVSTPPSASTPPVAVTAAAVAAAAASASSAPASGADDIAWVWPVKGKVIAPFSEASKGVDLSGTKGAPVGAAAAGKVTYAGNGIRGLGQLIVIRHSANWLSAYGHNDKLLVKEGQEVTKGQKIAEMGATDTDQVKLHFQIRKQGKPVDPTKFLPGM